MKTKFIPSALIAFFALLTASMLNACSDSDDLLYDEENHSEITIDAKMTKSFDSTATIKDADTVSFGDSVIFIATVNPSKSVRIRKSYWEVDSMIFAKEFTVREAITLPGKHDFIFVLIDFFGDTLRDTVQLWVSRPPVINTTSTIPLNGSQGLPPNKEIQFVWQASDPDSLLQLHYHFTLTNLLKNPSKETNIIDTILNEPIFSCNKELEPLSIYRWTVQAYNEYGQASAQKISNDFSTAGVKDESGIYGIIKPSASNLYANIDIFVLDSIGTPTGISTIMKKTSDESAFKIGPLPPGSYKVTANYKDAPDYIADTLPVTLHAGEVVLLDTLHLSDVIPPTITSVTGSDTLDFADSLSFRIKDGDGTNNIQDMVIRFGNRKISSFKKNEDVITFPTTSDDSSWFIQLLTISAKDASGNIVQKDLYIRPAHSWIKTNGDTTISTQKSLQIFIQDVNQFDFKPKLYTINLHDDEKGTVRLPYDSTQAIVTYSVDADLFYENPQKITVSVIYENSFVQSSSWILTFNEPPEMDINNCKNPCNENIQVGSSAEFEWTSALDSENDSLVYRVGYTLSENESNPENFIYPRDFIKGTKIVLRNLPVGDIYWWVEAMDPYGGTSQVWDTKVHTVIYDDTPPENSDSTSKKQEDGNET